MRPVVFLSRPAVLSADQETAFSAWSQMLDLDFDVQRLERHQYAEEPWAQLRAIFTQVDGVATFGFRQDVRQLDVMVAGASRTSPWIHIEAAMAIALRVPVLAIAEQGVADGVFEPAVWAESLYGVPAGTAPSRRAIPRQWIEAVHRAFTARQRLAGNRPSAVADGAGSISCHLFV